MNDMRSKINSNVCNVVFTFILAFSAVFMDMEPVSTNLMKYVVIPICFVFLFNSCYFDSLIFGMMFIGLAFGKPVFIKGLSYLWIYPALLFCKLLWNKKIFRIKNIFKSPVILLIVLYDLFFLIRIRPTACINQVLYVVLAFCLFEDIHSDKDIQQVVLFVISLFASVSSIGTLTNPGLVLIETGFTRYAGSGFSDPNYSAVFSLMGMIAALFMDKRFSVYKIVSFVCCTYGVLVSVSKAALFVFAVASILYVVVQSGWKKKLGSFIGIIVYIFTIIFVLSVLLPDMGMNWRYRLGLIVNDKYESTVDQEYMDSEIMASENVALVDNITTGRFSIWMTYLKMIFEQPISNILFGVKNIYDPHFTARTGGLYSHNTYIDMLLQFGVVGFIFIMGIWCFDFFRTFGVILKNKKDDFEIACFLMKSIIAVSGLGLSLMIYSYWPVCFFMF